MYKFNKEAFKRFFFYGDENPEEALEGIMFFVDSNELFEKCMKAKKGMTEKQMIDEFVESVKPLYKQYYRFIELNNKTKIYNMYKQTNERELEERIRSKIEQLKNTDEIITEEEIQSKIWEETQNREVIYRRNEKSWTKEEKENWKKQTEGIAKRIRKDMEKRRRKQLVIGNNHISYSIVQRFKYAHLPEYSITEQENNMIYPAYIPFNKQEWYPEQKKIQNCKVKQDKQTEYIPYKLRHWTEDLYDLLKFLNEVENKDVNAYIDMWLRTRLKRAENGTIEGIEETEMKRINRACQRWREMRKEDEKKKEKGQMDFIEIE